MELKVKEIIKKSVINDKGFVIDAHSLTLEGTSQDGALSAKVTFKSEDPDLINSKVRMVHGTKMNLELVDVNHTLDKFDTPERPLMSSEDADASSAALAAVNAQN